MGKRILVADDSVTIQRAFAMVLGVEDVSLIAARSWDEALSAARQQRPDLIFADANLGDRSGYDLCAAIKSDRADVPVIILASAQVPYDPERGQRARADGHFIKPFESTKLLELVNTARAATRDAAPPRTATAPIPVLAETTSKVAADNFDDEDSYGEFTIEPTGGAPAPAPAPVAVKPAVSAPQRPAAAPLPPRAAVPPAMSRPATAAPGLVPPRPPLPAAQPAPAVARPSSVLPSAPSGRPAPAPAPVAASTSVPTTPKAPPRPSLIPGVMPPRTADASAASSHSRPAANPAPSAPVDYGRTMMGMPAAPVPVPDRSRARPVSGLSASLFDGVDVPQSAPAPQAPMVDTSTPLAAKTKEAPGFFESRTQERVTRPDPVVPPVAAKLAEKVSDKLTQKMAEVSARGPEYEAIAKLSREIIEQVVWEVVPELAEVMIREHIERLAAKR